MYNCAGGVGTSTKAQHIGSANIRRVAVSDDEREFERLYRESYNLVYNYVYFRMPGSGAVEDVVAETFMQAARYYDRFDPARAKFSTWVISIAKNSVNSYYRKASNSVALEDVSEAALSVPGEQDLADDRALAEQLLRTLDDDERELVFRKYYLGMRNVEIAQELDLNASTVSTRLMRAMAKMREAAGGTFI